jgi:GT2 family glycosyltransferase
VTRDRPFRAPSRPEVRPLEEPPSFSVAVKAYQAAAVVGEAIDSALEQTHAPHEIVVCDDGSTDGTADVLAAYGDRIRVLRKENGGPASALNACMRAATGDFLAVLDADDVFLPERLEALAGLAMERPDLDVLGTDAWFEVEGERVGRFNGPRNPFPTVRQERSILERCWVGWPAIRRSRLLEHGGADETLRLGEDWELLIRLIKSGSRAGLVDEPLLCYRLHETNLTASRAEALRARVMVLEKTRRSGVAAQDRDVLEASLAAHRRRAVAAETEDALLGGGAGVRRTLLQLAAARGVPPATRLKTVLAAVSPSWAARAVRRRARPELARPIVDLDP